MRDLAGIELKRSDFDAIRVLCKDDPRFPANWPAWLRLMRMAATDAVAAGHIPGVLELSPHHFETWCERVGIMPCVDALRAYAIVHRSAWAAGVPQTAATPKPAAGSAGTTSSKG